MKVLIFVLLNLFIFSFNSTFAQKKSKKDQLITINTSYGEINLLLYDLTPKHKANFLKHVSNKYYDGTSFHFVLNNFMILGGDSNTKFGGNRNRVGLEAPYTLEAEILPELKHKRGSIGAARQNDEINEDKRSSGSHFYIIQNQENASHMDGDYTIFGEIIKGIAVIDSIAQQEVDNVGAPLDKILISVTAEEMKKKQITKIYGYEYPN